MSFKKGSLDLMQRDTAHFLQNRSVVPGLHRLRSYLMISSSGRSPPAFRTFAEFSQIFLLTCISKTHFYNEILLGHLISERKLRSKVWTAPVTFLDRRPHRNAKASHFHFIALRKQLQWEADGWQPK